MAEAELILKPIRLNGTLRNQNRVQVGVASAVTTLAAVHHIYSPHVSTFQELENAPKVNIQTVTSRYRGTKLPEIELVASPNENIKQPQKRPRKEGFSQHSLQKNFPRRFVSFKGKSCQRQREIRFNLKSKFLTKNEAPNSKTIYKKSSPNGKLTTYLAKRDFYDHKTWQDDIDGVIFIDPDYLKNRKVFGLIVVAFRYGREDLDVMGVSFRKDFAVKQQQIYPPLEDNKHPLTKLQSKLLNKLGEDAVPFHFDLPTNTPDTVCIQPSEYDGGQPCGVDYQVTTYVANNMDDKIHKRNSVSLGIRKLTYLEYGAEEQPRGEVTKEFKFTSGAMKLECTLDKPRYFSGESMNISICVDNPTSKKAKRIKIQVLQLADICLYENITYKSIVTELESEEGFPIEPNTSGFCQVYKLRPVLDAAKRREGLALNGRTKYQDTTLAATTDSGTNVQKENMGVIVSYKVRIKMTLGFGSGDMVLEVPFSLSPARLKGNLGLPETKEDDESDREECDLVLEDFKRIPVKGFEDEVSGALTSAGF